MHGKRGVCVQGADRGLLGVQEMCTGADRGAKGIAGKTQGVTEEDKIISYGFKASSVLKETCHM